MLFSKTYCANFPESCCNSFNFPILIIPPEFLRQVSHNSLYVEGRTQSPSIILHFTSSVLLYSSNKYFNVIIFLCGDLK